MQPRIHVVTLGVDEVARASAFYERMGWEKSPHSVDDVAFFQANGLVLALYPWPLLAEDATVPADGAGFRRVTLAHNVERKEDVAKVLAEAEAAGGRIVKPAQEVFWGGVNGYFADPDGHLWEVAWNPSWPIASDGRLILPPR